MAILQEATQRCPNKPRQALHFIELDRPSRGPSCAKEVCHVVNRHRQCAT